MFKKMSLRMKIMLGACAPMLVAGGVFAIAYMGINTLHTGIKLVDDTHTVLASSAKIERLVLDMETGERGFLITGDDAFLEPYENSNEKLGAHIQGLKKLVSDNPSQVRILEGVERDLAQWHKVAGDVEIAAKREAEKGTVDAEKLQALLRAGVGKRILDELRSVMDGIEDTLKRAGNTNARRINLAIAKDMVDMETGERGFLITGTDEFLEPYRNGQRTLVAHIEELRNAVAGRAHQASVERALVRVETLSSAWLAKAAGPEIQARVDMNNTKVTNKDVIALIKQQTGKNIIDALRAKLKIFEDAELKLLTKRNATLQASTERTTQSLVTGAIGVVFASIIISFFIAGGIINPLNKLIEMLRVMAKGDLTQRIEIETQDEIGQLGAACNSFVIKVNSMISAVAATTTQLAAATKEMTSTSQEMAAGAEEQTHQAAQVATSMEEMSATVQEVAKNANKAAENAKDSGITAKKGGSLVQSTVDGIKGIASSVEDLQTVIKGLSKNSEKIGEIVGVIDDVADQTNLLALNAAIEAARAGEQGRGFAVVADEVRKLAERTTSSTKEIAQMVKNIQGDTNQAVSSMDGSAKEVMAGVKLAEQAGESLEEIVDGTKSVQGMVQEIAKAAEQQSAAAEEISINIEAIASVSKQTAEGSQQTSQAALGLSRTAAQLKSLVDKFTLNKTQLEVDEEVAAAAMAPQESVGSIKRAHKAGRA